MIYITQLVFVKEGRENIFQEFENLAIPLIEQYNGKLVYRLRPDKSSFINLQEEAPYEIHVISFQSENDLNRFINDENRKKFIHLKDESVQYQILIKGIKL